MHIPLTSEEITKKTFDGNAMTGLHEYARDGQPISDEFERDGNNRTLESQNAFIGMPTPPKAAFDGNIMTNPHMGDLNDGNPVAQSAEMDRRRLEEDERARLTAELELRNKPRLHNPFDPFAAPSPFPPRR